MSDKVPICFMVDDSTALVNCLYYVEQQVRRVVQPCQKSGEPISPEIPYALAERFAELLERFGVRGKFSVVPYPAGLGSIVDGWPSLSSQDLAPWLTLFRQRIAPWMDITPEMMTHSLAMDLSTFQLLDECERPWSQKQDASALTQYITAALKILKQAGFDANGVTSPWDFGMDNLPNYCTAIMHAQQQVYRRNLSWFFGTSDFDPHGVQSHIAHRDQDAAVVSIVAKYGDNLWQTMETRQTDDAYITSIADDYITADASDGHLVELYQTRQPIVFLTHWQSLYSNGRYTGCRALELVLQRIDNCWADKVQWVTCSTLAQQLIQQT